MPRHSALAVTLACAAIATVGIGCTEGTISRDAAGAALVVRTGFACARGCALDRSVLIGSELVADVIAPVQASEIEARAIDPSVAAAWVEPVRLCCGRGIAGSCRAMAPGEVECGGEETKRARVVIRALRAGETAIELLGAAGAPIEAVPLRVDDAIEVSAIPMLGAVGSDGDRDLAGGPVAQAWIDGRLERLELRAGQVARVRVAAIGPDGRELLVGEGIGARIVDPGVARIGPASGVCSGAVADGPLLTVEGASGGTTVLALQAGSAVEMIEIVVRAACEPVGRVEPTAVACATDADCVPAGCCHPETCTAPAQAPSCEDALCTLECRIGTLDCGGRCLCLEGRCAAYVPSLPDPECAPQEGGPALDPRDIPRDGPTEGPF